MTHEIALLALRREHEMLTRELDRQEYCAQSARERLAEAEQGIAECRERIAALERARGVLTADAGVAQLDGDLVRLMRAREPVT